MKDSKIKPRVRLIIIQDNKILLSYVESKNFYFYIGGKMEWGETIKEACRREVLEECNASFKFEKILYIRDFIKREEDEHSIEFFISGKIDKGMEIEGLLDKEYDGDHWQTWVDLKDLEKIDIRPKRIGKQIIKDYKSGFQNHAIYLGEID